MQKQGMKGWRLFAVALAVMCAGCAQREQPGCARANSSETTGTVVQTCMSQPHMSSNPTRETVGSLFASVKDGLALSALFTTTNWWETDQARLSNLLERASFETCNELCNVTGGNEDYFVQRLIASFGLQKAASLVQSNNMLLRIAESSGLMQDIGSVTQALQMIVDDGSPATANYCYQKETWWKKAYAQCGDLDGMIGQAETILEKYSDVLPYAKPMEYMSLAKLYLYKGDHERTAKWLQAYLALDRKLYRVGEVNHAQEMLEQIHDGTWRTRWRKPTTRAEWMEAERRRGVPWPVIERDILDESPAPTTPTRGEQLRNYLILSSNAYHGISK